MISNFVYLMYIAWEIVHIYDTVIHWIKSTVNNKANKSIILYLPWTIFGDANESLYQRTISTLKIMYIAKQARNPKISGMKTVITSYIPSGARKGKKEFNCKKHWIICYNSLHGPRDLVGKYRAWEQNLQ